jgi:hypothetical protein
MSESKEGWAERRAATRREWERIIGEFEATGMTGAAFCRDRGFPEWKFSYWRKVLRRPEDGSGAFVELGLDKATSVIWIECGRWRIQVGTDFDARALRRVAEALS